MPSVLGKRKSRSHNKSSAANADANEDANDVFRRLFEQRFTPLEPVTSTRRPPKRAAPVAAHNDESDPEEDQEEEGDYSDTDLDEDESDSEWGGVSDADGDDHDHDHDSIPGLDEVEVVDYSCNPVDLDAAPAMTKQELRAYMQQSAAAQKTKTKKPAPAEDSADLVANDLALQRLLSESHLLSAAAGHASSSATLLSSVAVQTRPSAASSAVFAEGRLRRRTADLRMQALGSRESVFAQRKMPLAMRRGIAQHRADREARRRREARECGVVLEAPAPSSSSSSSRRRATGGGGGGARRGAGGPKVGMPGVGRLRGAELRISARDVRDIEGRKAGPEKRRKKRR